MNHMPETIISGEIHQISEYLNYMEQIDQQKYSSQAAKFKQFANDFSSSTHTLTDTLLFLQQIKTLNLSLAQTKNLFKELGELRDLQLIEQKEPTQPSQPKKPKSLNSSLMNSSLHSSTNQQQFVAQLDKLHKTTSQMHVKFFDEESSDMRTSDSDVFSEIHPHKPFQNEDYVEVMIQQEIEIQQLKNENNEYKQIISKVMEAIGEMEFEGKERLLKLLE